MHHRPSAHRNNVLTQRAASLFEWLWFKAHILKLLAPFRKDDRTIPFLSDESIDMSQITVVKLDMQPIRLESIVGTQGRMNYDKDFLPLQHRDKKRWMSVAIAMMGDPTVLAPISVVQIDDRYYTSDGNHRVSVAKALDKLFIDANVTQWIRN